MRKLINLLLPVLVFSLSLSSVSLAEEVETYSQVDVQVRDDEHEGVADSTFDVYIYNEETEEYDLYAEAVETNDSGTVNNYEVPIGSQFCMIAEDAEGTTYALSGTDSYPNTWIAVEEDSIKNIDLTAGIGGGELYRSPSPYVHLYAGENPEGVTCLGIGEEGDSEEEVVDEETDTEEETTEDSEDTEETVEDEVELPTYYEGAAEDFDPTTYLCADFPDAIYEDVAWEGCEAIWYTFIEEVFTGTDEGLLEWDRPINRAEVTKVMIEYFDVDLLEDYSDVDEFPDVPEDEWYTEYVYTARHYEIVEGYGDGYFRPEQTVTRAEMLKIFLITAGLDYESMDTESSYFDDIEVTEDGPWYIQYANFAYIHDLVSHDGNLYPEEAMTRLDAILLLFRGAELIEVEDDSSETSDDETVDDETTDDDTVTE